MNSKTSLLVMMGLDKDGKPRAAVFAPEDTETVIKAAKSMGLRVARAETSEALAIAKQLPRGKLYTSGKGLMPLVRREVFDRLVKLILPADSKQEAPSLAPAPTDAQPKATSPTEKNFINAWQALEVGATCLWRASKDEGWFEAVIVSVSADANTLLLKWRDYKSLPQFRVKRSDVGVLGKVR